MSTPKKHRAMNRRDLVKAAGAGAVALGGIGASAALAAGPTHWDLEADIVVIGSGAMGLPAAIVAKEAGLSVIVVEAENHVGGHAIVSGGTVVLGGGTSAQKKFGITDSPDLLFSDLTDWTVVEDNGAADYRFNDREIIRAFADNAALTYEWLAAHGVVFIPIAPDSLDGVSSGNSTPRSMHAASMDWPKVQTGKPLAPEFRSVTGTGAGLMRPLQAAAEKAGVQILLQHRMTAIYREEPKAGRVLGIAVNNNGKPLNIMARQAVIIGTGGSTGNVNFRRMFDPRLTEEYCGLAGMPWSDQDASGELAGMAIGASLWGFANQSGEFGSVLSKAGFIGCQYNYMPGSDMLILPWLPGSEVFDKARASGLRVAHWEDVILVNMLGKRFYDETQGAFTADGYNSIKPYTQDSYRNGANITFKPNNFIDAALAGIGDGHNGGGPIWAIFDADAVARENWDPTPPNVDFAAGFFFTANTVAELAGAIKMQHQRVPMPPGNLEATVTRYNSFVGSDVDADFGRVAFHKIAKPPFYAAWSTPNIHDTRAGLRINAHCQVLDMSGTIIPGLYCGGESAGGFSQHGLARATCQGYIAGNTAVSQKGKS
jgi:hypothetical protein